MSADSCLGKLLLVVLSLVSNAQERYPTYAPPRSVVEAAAANTVALAPCLATQAAVVKIQVQEMAWGGSVTEMPVAQRTAWSVPISVQHRIDKRKNHTAGPLTLNWTYVFYRVDGDNWKYIVVRPSPSACR